MAISSVSSNPIYSAISASKTNGASLSSLTDSTDSTESSTLDSFTQKLADSNPNVANALAELRATQSLMGLADATFSGNSSAFASMFGVDSSDPYMATLSAAYLVPIQEKYDAFLKKAAGTDATGGTGSTPTATTIDLEQGLSISATGKADEGKYTLAYDKDKQTFTLTGGDFEITAAIPTDSNGTAKSSINFGNGITLNMDKTFDASKALKDQSFSVSY